MEKRVRKIVKRESVQSESRMLALALLCRTCSACLLSTNHKSQHRPSCSSLLLSSCDSIRCYYIHTLDRSFLHRTTIDLLTRPAETRRPSHSALRSRLIPHSLLHRRSVQSILLDTCPAACLTVYRLLPVPSCPRTLLPARAPPRSCDRSTCLPSHHSLLSGHDCSLHS